MDQESRLKGFLKSLRLNESTISTFLGALVVIVVGILVYNYFSSVNKMKPEAEQVEYQLALVEEEGQMIPDQLPVTHQVQAGDHLWALAEQYYHSGYNWVDIAEANNLANANLIAEGMDLTIPRVAVKPATVDETALMMPGEVSLDQMDSLASASEYTVVKGDSLWQISVKAYADGYQWTKIWEANRSMLPNPNLLEAGTVLTLPR